MVDFVFASPSLEALGPTIELEVHVSIDLARQMLARGAPVPKPVLATAVVDTGATWCVFKPDIFRRLAIEPYDVASISTASSLNESQYVYWVDLSLAGHRLERLSALEAPLLGCPAQGLIGRNVLKRSVFCYDGRLNPFTLSF